MAYWVLVAAVLVVLVVLWRMVGSNPPTRRRPRGKPVAARLAQPTAAKAAAEFAQQPTQTQAPDSGAESSLSLSAAQPPSSGTQPLSAIQAEPPPELLSLCLLNDSLLAPDVALRLTTLADSLPRPRSVMLQLVQAGDDPSELARIVATDPATAALLLRTVNSAQFSLASEITSVQHAITYLGANLVRDVAIRHAMAVPINARNLTAERIYQSLWRSSYLASGVALVLAQRLRLPAPAALSTQALLFTLGDIAVVSYHPEVADLYHADLDLAALVASTQERLGFNSAMIGAYLAQVWQLPVALRGVLRHSLAPLVGGPQTIEPQMLPGLVIGYFSNRLAQALWRQVDYDLFDAMQTLLARPEAYYLPLHLAAVGLADALAVLTDPAVERRLLGLMNNLSDRR